MKVIWRLFLMLGVFWAMGVAGAEEKKKTILPEVVVTESRIEEAQKEVTTSVTIITEEEIQGSSAKDLGDLLAEKGYPIIKYPGSLTSVQIRGFRTDVTGNDLLSRVLVLIDGRRSSTGNLAKILTKNIERIEILSGPASVQYGSAAIGGVINVITRQGKGKPSVFLEGKIGSWGYEEGTLGLEGKYQGFDFAGSFSRDTMEDYDTGGGKRYYNTGYKSRENSSVNIGYEFIPNNRIGLLYHYFNGKHIGTTDYITMNDLDDYAEKKASSWDLVYSGKTADSKFLWNARYFEGKDKNKWIDPVASNPDGWDDGLPIDSEIKQKGGQAQISSELGFLLASLGLDWVKYDVTTSWDPKETEYDNPAYYLLLKSRLLDKRLIASGGVRYDRYDVEVKQGQGESASDDKFSPRVGLAYLISECLKLRANYGEAFRMPEAMQLAGNIGMWGITYKGNPMLKPEKSKTYEGGFDVTLGAFEGSITLFTTRLRDKIQQVSTGPTTVSWQNLGSASLKGFEGSLSYDIGSVFDLPYEIRPYLKFTRMATYKDKHTQKSLYYVPDWSLSCGIGFSHEKDFSLNLNFSYTGKQLEEDWPSGIWPVPVVQRGGYTVTNLTVKKKIFNFRQFGDLSLIGEVQNTFDTNYEYKLGYPMPGRSLYLGIRYDL